MNMKGFLMRILCGWCNIDNCIFTIGHNDKCNCKPWSCHCGMYPYEWNSKWSFHIVVSNCQAFICTSHMHPILLFSQVWKYNLYGSNFYFVLCSWLYQEVPFLALTFLKRKIFHYFQYCIQFFILFSCVCYKFLAMFITN